MKQFDPMFVIFMTVLLSLVLLAVVAMVLSFLKTLKSPQFTCLHDPETIKVREGKSSTEYLSTCKKCGQQKTHIFSGMNGW